MVEPVLPVMEDQEIQVLRLSHSPTEVEADVTRGVQVYVLKVALEVVVVPIDYQLLIMPEVEVAVIQVAVLLMEIAHQYLLPVAADHSTPARIK